jgi:hypothetical protein
MTMDDLTLQAIASVLGLCVIVWFFYGPWQGLVVDLARQRLFEIRDSLFDFSASGKLGFNSPSYVFARQRLNAIIRFAHRVSFWRFLVFSYVMKDYAVEDPLHALRSDRSEAARFVLTRMHRADVIVAVLILIRSPFLIVMSLCLALPFIIAAFLSDRVRSMPREVRTRVSEEIEREVMSEEYSHDRKALAS